MRHKSEPGLNYMSEPKRNQTLRNNEQELWFRSLLVSFAPFVVKRSTHFDTGALMISSWFITGSSAFLSSNHWKTGCFVSTTAGNSHILRG